MQDWFEWNGVRSTDYGIYVTEQPPPTVPSERATFTDVPGRSGSLTKLQGDYVYDDMVLTCTCVISDPSNLSEIAAWLCGSGKVIFANRDGGFYYARVVNQIPFEKILRGNPHRSFAVNFRCKPFWYEDSIKLTTVTPDAGSTTGTTTLTNPGSVPSEPVITITGTGEITLMVGMQIIELSEMDGSIIIDSELQEAYYESTSMNSKMSGDFPLLLPGANAISWSGSVTSLVIQPNWRYLL